MLPLPGSSNELVLCRPMKDGRDLALPDVHWVGLRQIETKARLRSVRRQCICSMSETEGRHNNAQTKPADETPYFNPPTVAQEPQ